MPPIVGLQLVLLTFAVSLGIFMNVLDTSIANVAIPSIAGDLAVSPDEGTWVITSFTVSMAIVLPLTGWLSRRFGEVRLFLVCTSLFTVMSILCGLSSNLASLVLFRVLQGAVAGPMVPLSQSLLLANYPENKKGLATALWATVAVAAPVLGPILGGYITDNFEWPWIFYINLPIGIGSVILVWLILRKRETPISKMPIDFMGLLLLALGIGCLQVLLDRGKDLDWFHSPTIVILACISLISITFLLIWELTDESPILDLSLFKQRNFTIGTIAISLGFGTYFGGVVILPLWLQTQMGYTPTWAGTTTATLGILPMLVSPFMGFIMEKVDLRCLTSLGFLIFAYCSLWVGSFNTDITSGDVALSRFAQGLGAPLFFIPTISILLSKVPNKDLANAAGLSNFFRILAGSFGTSISVTAWDQRERVHQSQIVQQVTSLSPNMQNAIDKLQSQGFNLKATYATLHQGVVRQSYMLATNDIFLFCAAIFLFLMMLIWLARPPFLTQKGMMVE